MPNLVMKDYEAWILAQALEPEKSRQKKGWARTLFIVLVMVFLFLPIIVLVVFSFNESKMNIIFTGFTLDWYARLFENKELVEAFRNTLVIAGLSTAVSVVIGTVSAVGMRKFDFWSKKLVDKLIYIPIVIPEIVLGISLLSVFSLLNIELGFWSVLLAHIAFSVPFVITSVRSALYALPTSVEEAAKDLGANRLQTFFYVTLPMIMPGVVSGAILSFTLSLDDVVISYFTAGPGTNTLPLYIYSIIKTGITPDVNALTSLMLVFTVVALVVSSKIQTRLAQRRARVAE